MLRRDQMPGLSPRALYVKRPDVASTCSLSRRGDRPSGCCDPGGFMGVSGRTLHEQRFEPGLIASRDPHRFIRVGREVSGFERSTFQRSTFNVPHLLPGKLDGKSANPGIYE
jgi:hypothetical protein